MRIPQDPAAEADAEPLPKPCASVMLPVQGEGAITTYRPKLIFAVAAIVIVAGMTAYYKWVHHSRGAAPFQAAYVLSPSLDLFDSPAEVHSVVEVLKSGERVQILSQVHDWTKILAPDGDQGWVPSAELIDASTYEQGQKLLASLTGHQAQAAGDISGPVNLHTAPGRDAPVLCQLGQGQNVQIYNRRLVSRGATSSNALPVLPSGQTEAWYMIRAGSRVGWVLGRLVSLDIPPAISQYAQSFNVVAWFTLKTLDDNGRQVPEYLVADRVDSDQFDFTHIRVFTWWAKRHRYVTAYVESGLKGQFPIEVQAVNGQPYFRLRLIGDHDQKIQKVYGLFDTIVRPVRTVTGWDNEAMPGESGHHGSGKLLSAR